MAPTAVIERDVSRYLMPATVVYERDVHFSPNIGIVYLIPLWEKDEISYLTFVSIVPYCGSGLEN
jgi:hypothetical protein